MKIKVVQLELKNSHEIEIPLESDRIFVAQQAAPIFCQTIGALNVEQTAMICLDRANRVINYFTVSIGNIDSVKVSLAQMFRTALLSKASEPPRSSTALPDLIASAAASTVTLGRDS